MGMLPHRCAFSSLLYRHQCRLVSIYRDRLDGNALGDRYDRKHEVSSPGQESKKESFRADMYHAQATSFNYLQSRACSRSLDRNSDYNVNARKR